MAAKKLYIISELFYPNMTSTAHIMTQFAESLAKEYDVTVITTDLKYDDNITDKVKDSSNYEVIRKTTKESDKNNFIARVTSSFQNSLLLINELKKRVKKDDMVFLVSNPFNIIFFAATFRKVKRFSLNVLVHDVFPENTVPPGILKPNSLAYKLNKTVFNWSYRKADRLFVLGRDMLDIVSRKGVNKDNIHILPNWFDHDLEQKEINKDIYYGIEGLNKKTVIGFAGNIGRVQGLDMFVRCFIEAKNPNIALVLIGDGAELNNLKAQAGNHPDIHFIGMKPRDEQSSFINSFDIALVTLSEGMYGLGVPSKSYNLLKAGKPILYIGDSATELDLLLRETKGGWSFQWKDSDKLIDFLKSINLIESDFYRKNNIAIAEAEYSMDKIHTKLISILNE